MATGFNRLVVGLLAKSRAERKWLIRSLRSHMRARAAGGEVRPLRTRSMRLGLGQYLLCEGHDHPARTILAPCVALALYLSSILYMVLWGK